MCGIADLRITSKDGDANAAEDTIQPRTPLEGCAPLTATALRSADVGAVLSSAEKADWRAETFDMAAISVILVHALCASAAHEHEAFWCLHHFFQKHVRTGAVFALMHTLELHLSQHDPQLLEHVHHLGLNVCDISRVWIRSFFAGALPLFHLLPLWDVMFCVGADFAVAVAAALFEMLRARLVDTCDRGAFLQLLCVGPRHLAADIDLVAAALLVWEQHVSAVVASVKQIHMCLSVSACLRVCVCVCV